MRKPQKRTGQKAASGTFPKRQESSSKKECNDSKKSTVSLDTSGPPDVGKKRTSNAVASCYPGDEIHESRAILHALMNAPLDVLTVLDRDGTFLEVNPIVCKRFGLSRETLLGRSAWELFPVQVTEQRKAAFEKAHQTSSMVRFEDERDGRHFDHVIYPVVEPDGDINKFVVFARDITKLKKTEEALRESEERYRLIFERTSDMVSIVTFSDPPSYVYVNPSYHVILGYKPEDLIGKSSFDFIHPEDIERRAPVLRGYLEAKSQGSLIRGGKGPTERMIYRLKDAWGSWRYLEGTVDLMGEEHILMVSRDVSARILAEQDLERLRTELEGKVEERSKELKMKSESLEATNTALKVLLEMRERDRKELEQTVLFNVRQLAEPYIEKLRDSGLNETQRGFVGVLESSLQELISPLSRDLVVSDKNLTPTQVRIANLIKYGKSSKEIAEALNVSINTVETHRRRIRAKLGLSKVKANLRSYLDQYSTHRKG